MKPKAGMSLYRKTTESVFSELGVTRRTRRKDGPVNDKQKTQTDSKESHFEPGQYIVSKPASIDSEPDILAAFAICGTGTHNADYDTQTVEDECMDSQERDKCSYTFHVEAKDDAYSSGKKLILGKVDDHNGVNQESPPKYIRNAQRQSKK